MHTRTPLLTLGVLLALAFAPPARAQDNPVLPDLTPREVEIRGELTIRFPSLRRQPLVGFNPPPRIPDIPADRRPYAEAYKQDRAELPLSPLREPSAPAVSPYLEGPRYTGMVEAGAGRYSERLLAADLAGHAASGASWTLEGAYRGRSGFEPYPDADASFDRGELRLAGSVPLGGLELGGRMDARYARYALYGVVPQVGSVALPAPDRTVRGGSLGLFLARQRGPVRFRLDASLASSDVETDAFAGEAAPDPGTQHSDGTLSAGGRIETLRDGLNGWVDARLAGTSLEDGLFSSSDVRSHEASAGLRTDIDGIGRLSAGVSILGSAREPLEPSESKRTWTRLAPTLRFEAAPWPRVRLSLVQQPRVETARLLGVFTAQPYVADAAMLEAEVWPVDARLRATAALGRVEVTVGTGLRRSPNRRYFEHDPALTLEYSRGISAVRHGRAREVDATVDVTAYVGASIQAGLGATVRSARLTGLDADVPYVAPWTLRSLASAALFDGRGLVQLTARIEGPRYRDVAESLELPAFADLDLLASYRVTRNASVVLRLENLGGNRPEWDRYLRPPSIFTAGLSWAW